MASLTPYYVMAAVGGSLLVLVLAALIALALWCRRRATIVHLTHEEAMAEFGYSEDQATARAKASRKKAKAAAKSKAAKRRGGARKGSSKDASGKSKKAKKSKDDKLARRRAAAARSKRLGKAGGSAARYNVIEVDMEDALAFSDVTVHTARPTVSVSTDASTTASSDSRGSAGYEYCYEDVYTYASSSSADKSSDEDGSVFAGLS